jgi:hypothetical protein
MCCNHDQSSSPATYQTGPQNHLLWGPCPCEARRPLDHGIRHQCRLRQPLPEQQHARRLAPYLPGAAVSTLLELVQSWHQPSTAYPCGSHGTGAEIPPQVLPPRRPHAVFHSVPPGYLLGKQKQYHANQRTHPQCRHLPATLRSARNADMWYWQGSTRLPCACTETERGHNSCNLVVATDNKQTQLVAQGAHIQQQS